jgi:hypothetical protein
MLAAVTGQRLRIMTVALLAAATLAGCASTTHGAGSVSGSVSGTPRTSAPATPDFPSGSATRTTSPPAPSTPTVTSSEAGPRHPVPSAPLKTITVRTADSVTYVVKLWADVENDTCFDHAYGSAVVTFLTKHPCTGLRRVLGTTAVKGRGVGFAESATGFHSPGSDPYKWASEFIKLEEQDGTGSINDLLREGYRLPEGPAKIPSSQAFNVIGQDEGVTIWDAWYLDGPTPDNDKALIKMTVDLFLRF